MLILNKQISRHNLVKLLKFKDKEFLQKSVEKGQKNLLDLALTILSAGRSMEQTKTGEEKTVTSQCISC